MRTRMVLTACLAASALTLGACNESDHHVDAPPPVPATRPVVSAPAPAMRPVIQPLPAKPPVLGPVSPAIVILPEHIAEPTIRVRLTDEMDRPPAVDRNKYRGRIENFRMADGKYVAINVVPLDSYLQGVLKKELYGDWEPATYRAQAIAARTFALFEMLTDGRGKQWDVNNDESSQMYGGIAAETAKSRAAVAATRGQVLMAALNGKVGIFCSRYSACIGGKSQDPSEAWGDPSLPVLAAHDTGSVDDNSDKFTWDREFVVSKADATRCIESWGERNHFDALAGMGRGGRIESITITKRNAETGRPAELLLTDSASHKALMRAEEFRIALLTDPAGRAPKPYSSDCDIRVQGDAFVLCNGHGYGHGIGMSQWGAQNLAKKGWSEARILAFFYPGAKLEELW